MLLRNDGARARISGVVTQQVTRNVTVVEKSRHIKYTFLKLSHARFVGRESSVGIATRYELDRPRIESRRERDDPQSSRPALGTTQPPIKWVRGFFPGSKAVEKRG